MARTLTALAVAAALVTGALNAPAVAAPLAPRVSQAAPAARANFDLRAGGSAPQVAALAQRAAQAAATPAARALRASLGTQGVIDIDGLTQTPREVSRLDGLLTSASKAAPTAVVLAYLRAHRDVFRLSDADLAALRLRRDYVDVAGIHHLSWTQYAGSTPVFGNGLQAAVTKTGQLVTVYGSPLTGRLAPDAVTKPIAGSAAISAARRDLHEVSTIPGAADTVHAVAFATPGGLRSAWETVTMSAARPAVHVIDAQTGRVLFRQSLSSDKDAPAATGKAFDYYPGAEHGGVTHDVNYTAKGWLAPTATVLSGDFSHAYSDVDDNNLPGKSEEVHPSSGTSWNYILKSINAPFSFCGNPLPCTWNPNVAYSWRANRAQNTAQVFYFVNNWHDHLKAAPIGFTEAAGNFQVTNTTGQGKGGDPVLTETEDGANTDHGLPDGNHIDNANMSTPPDGQSPRMQMYLQHQPGTTYPEGDPFAPTDVGDEADTVYHEYTHGLSNRLVVDANGVSTLSGAQPGAMGEAWSDWYAMDYLVARGLQADTSAAGNIVIFQFDGAGTALDRTEPIDCPVGATTRRCPGTAGAGSGGYTYGDFGKIIGRPEVHADGEIWAQTLWDLRGQLGSSLTESLVTRAMELSPASPSYLDMRNSILEADNAIYSGRDVKKIWTVFAHRGMGWFAGSTGGDDTSPTEDFSMPPLPRTPKGTLTGRITAAGTKAAVAGAVVYFGGHASGFAGDYSGTTDASGRYSIPGIFAGTYPKVVATGPGYDGVITTQSVNSGTTTRNFSLVEDLAAASGGATITSFTGPDYTDFGCGPGAAIDQSLGSGWGSTSDLSGGAVGPDTAKQVVIRLSRSVAVGTIAIDPNATCGDDPSSATGGYTVETSANGTSWRTAAQGTFAGSNNGHLNRIVPAASTGSGVRFVRLTLKGPQVFADGLACPSSGASGCDFLDMSEIALYAPGATSS